MVTFTVRKTGGKVAGGTKSGKESDRFAEKMGEFLLTIWRISGTSKGKSV